MTWISAIAIFFVVWWLVLFTTLPLGVRSQVEVGEVTLGTERGAPAKPWIFRKILLTTAIALVICATLYILTAIVGFRMDDLPHIVPDFQ